VSVIRRNLYFVSLSRNLIGGHEKQNTYNVACCLYRRVLLLSCARGGFDYSSCMTDGRGVFIRPEGHSANLVQSEECIQQPVPGDPVVPSITAALSSLFAPHGRGVRPVCVVGKRSGGDIDCEAQASMYRNMVPMPPGGSNAGEERPVNSWRGRTSNAIVRRWLVSCQAPQRG